MNANNPPIVRNQWYAASYSRDLGRKPLGRIICNEPVALYRRRDNSVVAMRDACSHRLLPLSLGMVEGDDIRCKYHGLKVDSTGRCIEMPLRSERCATAMNVPLYPVTERYGFVWVWIGDAQLADTALLPNFWVLEDPNWASYGGLFEVKCSYQLVVDNLMDLTHETYVHPETLGQQELQETPIRSNNENGRVIISRWMPGVVPSPAWAQLHGRPGLVNRWQICEFLPPSCVLIDAGVSSVEDAQTLENHEIGTRSYVINAVTPVTETTCLYFWGGARNFKLNDEGFSDQMRQMATRVFTQDVEILEAQQRSIDLNPHLRLQGLSVDAGAVRSRVVNSRLAASSN